MSMGRPLFLKCMILDHKLQRMLNDSKIAQLNSERPLHQTAVLFEISQSEINENIAFVINSNLIKGKFRKGIFETAFMKGHF